MRLLLGIGLTTPHRTVFCCDDKFYDTRGAISSLGLRLAPLILSNFVLSSYINIKIWTYINTKVEEK